MDEGVVVVPLIGVLELLLLASLSAVAFRRILEAAPLAACSARYVRGWPGLGWDRSWMRRHRLVAPPSASAHVRSGLYVFIAFAACAVFGPRSF